MINMDQGQQHQNLNVVKIQLIGGNFIEEHKSVNFVIKMQIRGIIAKIVIKLSATIA